jgi:predicted nuclease with TOPRIM domain
MRGPVISSRVSRVVAVSSKMMIDADSALRDQIDLLCETLKLKKNPLGRADVIRHLVAQTKASLDLRKQYEQLVDKCDEHQERIDELEEQVERLELEVRDKKEVIEGKRRVMIHLMGARPV